jgi:hypothetical protein
MGIRKADKVIDENEMRATEGPKPGKDRPGSYDPALYKSLVDIVDVPNKASNSTNMW